MTECVGFADCPCKRCRELRRSATERHAEHSTPDLNYCGACRTADRERHYVGPSAALLRSVTRSQSVAWDPETGWTA